MKNSLALSSRTSFFPLILTATFSITAAVGCVNVPTRVPTVRTTASDSNICDQQHDGKTADGESVVVCDMPFADRPMIRPPQDETVDLSHVQLSVGLRITNAAVGAASFIDRNGKEYAWLDEKGVPVDFRKPAKIFSALHMPSHRNMFLIYRVAGKIVKNPIQGNAYFTDGILVSKADPEILISACALDSALLGTWEGAASKHIRMGGPFVFSFREFAPLQIEFDSLSRLKGSQASLQEWDNSAHPLKDGTVFAVKGHITNWDNPVLSKVDGKSLDSLASLGNLSPFPSQANALSPNVQLYRIAGMHTSNDEPLVLLYPGYDLKKSPHPDDMPGSGMDGEDLAISPAALIQTSSDYTAKTLSESLHVLGIHPHGPPSGHSINLHWVKGNRPPNSCAH
jgi:hypothetical protein